MELKRKITINKWFIIRLLVLSLYVAWVIIYFLWGINYLYLGLIERSTPEIKQLSLQIESSREELANIPNLVVEREYQLAQAQQLLADEQSRTLRKLNINDLVRNIIETADKSQVKAVPLSTTSPGSKKDGQLSLKYWNISMSLEGKFKDVTTFIERVEEGSLSTATVTSTVMSRVEENSDNSNNQNNTANVSGTLELVIYSNP